MSKLRQNISMVDISSVIPNTWNYNEQSEEMFEKTKSNIEEFGMLKPLAVREYENKYEIIGGFHRWLAAKELGYKQILINNLGAVSDSEAKSLTILLNEIHGTQNAVKVGQLINSIYGSKDWELLIKVLPYDEDEIENYRKIAADAEKSLSEVKKEEGQKDIVYQLVVTDQHAIIIDKALALFEESVPVGERFYDIALKYNAEKI